MYEEYEIEYQRQNKQERKRDRLLRKQERAKLREERELKKIADIAKGPPAPEKKKFDIIEFF